LSKPFLFATGSMTTGVSECGGGVGADGVGDDDGTMMTEGAGPGSRFCAATTAVGVLGTGTVFPSVGLGVATGVAVVWTGVGILAGVSFDATGDGWAGVGITITLGAGPEAATDTFKGRSDEGCSFATVVFSATGGVLLSSASGAGTG